MRCDDCRTVQRERSSSRSYFIRVGKADLEVLGCREHVLQLLAQLERGRDLVSVLTKLVGAHDQKPSMLTAQEWDRARSALAQAKTFGSGNAEASKECQRENLKGP